MKTGCFLTKLDGLLVPIIRLSDTWRMSKNILGLPGFSLDFIGLHKFLFTKPFNSISLFLFDYSRDLSYLCPTNH